MPDINLNGKLEKVEDLLRLQLKGGRPLTPQEIEFKLGGIKNRESIYKELNKLKKFNQLTRIEIDMGSSTVVMYSIQKIYVKDIKVKVR